MNTQYLIKGYNDTEPKLKFCFMLTCGPKVKFPARKQTVRPDHREG